MTLREASCDATSHFCGFLEFEAKENSGSFTTKFFRLNTQAGVLEYYSDCEMQKGFEKQPDGSFQIYDISMAADASSMRPKIPNCFYFVVLGEKVYLKAANEKEKLGWINKLQDATRIVVQERSSLLANSSLQQPVVRVEVVGGVILKTPLEESREDSSSDESVPPSSSSPSFPSLDEDTIKCGYGIKQGGFRKSWKNRYFVLSKSGLRYYKSMEDKIPIRLIKLGDITEARLSIGIHLNREHLLEVVTATRVFYIQVNSAAECDSWILAINKCIHDVFGGKCVDAEIQTDVCGFDPTSNARFYQGSALPSRLSSYPAFELIRYSKEIRGVRIRIRLQARIPKTKLYLCQKKEIVYGERDINLILKLFGIRKWSGGFCQS